MPVVEVRNPSDYELNKLMEEADESSEWMIRERIPYVEDPEFNDRVFSDYDAACRFIMGTSFEPQVAASIVYVEVSGVEDDVLYDPAFERTLLNVSEETEQLIMDEKPDGIDLDEFLQDMVE